MANDPQVPWTDEQWARVNQVIQEEAKRARVAATFLPLYGPLSADSDYVRGQDIRYPSCRAGAVVAGRQQLDIDDRDTIRLATLQVIVPVRNAQMADPEMSSVLALFRRAANVVARLEDAVVFRGLAPPADLRLQRGLSVSPASGKSPARSPREGFGQELPLVLGGSKSSSGHPVTRGNRLVAAVSGAIGRLEGTWTLRSVCGRSLVNGCFLSRRPQTRGRLSCRRTGSSRSSAAVRCCVPRRSTIRRIQRRGRGARRRATRTRRRHGRMPPVPPGHRPSRRSSSGCPRRLRFASGSLTRSSNFICGSLRRSFDPVSRRHSGQSHKWSM